MGNFYTNITLIGVEREPVESWLRDAGRTAYLGAWGSRAVVFDQAGEIQDGSHAELAAELSAALGCVAIAALNHDDDMLLLEVFASGAPRGSYNSLPAFLDEDDGEEPAFAAGLDPSVLVSLSGTGAADRLGAVMMGDEVFAVDLHAKVVDERGVPAAAAGFGYEYLANGELPDDAEAGRLEQV